MPFDVYSINLRMWTYFKFLKASILKKNTREWRIRESGRWEKEREGGSEREWEREEMRKKKGSDRDKFKPRPSFQLRRALYALG